MLKLKILFCLSQCVPNVGRICWVLPNLFYYFEYILNCSLCFMCPLVTKERVTYAYKPHIIFCKSSPYCTLSDSKVIMLQEFILPRRNGHKPLYAVSFKHKIKLILT